MRKQRKSETNSQKKVEFLEKLGKKYSKQLSENRTPWESKIYKMLKDLHIPFEFQVPIICQKHKLYIADFLFKDKMLILEIDGKATHQIPERIKADKIRTKKLNKEGYRVIRIMNKMVSNLKKEELNQLLQGFVKIS